MWSFVPVCKCDKVKLFTIFWAIYCYNGNAKNCPATCAKSDVTFLCLPDEGSIETVQIANELGDKSPIIIDVEAPVVIAGDTHG